MRASLKYLSLITFFNSTNLVKGAKNGFIAQRISLTQPEDVGLGHSQIIHDLQDKLDLKQPNSEKEYLQFIALTMMDHFCDISSQQCNKNMTELVANITTDPQGGATTGFEQVSMNLLPEHFDRTVLSYLERLFDSVSLTKLHENPRDVLVLISNDFDELKIDENVLVEDHRLVGLVTYSVGIESIKQWNEVLNDKENPFYKMLTRLSRKHKRNLQATDEIINSLTEDAIEGIEFFKLIEADMIGASAGAISAIFDKSGNILSNSLTQASIASLKQVAVQIIPDVPEVTGCLFPDSELCNPIGNPVDSNSPGSDCLFPNSPVCIPIGSNPPISNDPGNSSSPNNPDDSENPCPFPNSPLCNPNFNAENSGSEGTPPNVPININPNNPDNPNIPEITGCLFPNSELCDQTGDSQIPNDEDAVNNAINDIITNPDRPTFCDLFPNRPGCSN